MNLDDRLKQWGSSNPIPIKEEQLSRTIQRVMEARYRQEKGAALGMGEFLWSQLRLTRKRWWLLQGLLLLLAWRILPEMDKNYLQLRTMGVVGCLFVVLMIPEFWRNQDNDSTQIEAACLYSLRQIYAARMTLFGIVDVGLITLFGLMLRREGLLTMELLHHFLLPATVTACICCRILCGRRNWGEVPCLAASLVWTGAWWLIILNQQIYSLILPPVWSALLVLALLLLAQSIRKLLNTANQYWEVDFFETAIG